MNLLDRMIAAASPQAGLRRAMARRRLDLLAATAKYDAASASRRTSGWRRVTGDANAETAGGVLGRLRGAAHDLVQNNGYAARGIAGIAHNVVGTGIVPQFTMPDRAAMDRLEGLKKDHFGTSAIDADGDDTLYGIQSLVMRAVAESGEVLVRRRWRRPEDGLPLPFQLEVLEADYIDTGKFGPGDAGARIVNGIEFDAIGRRIAYWLFTEHPGGSGTYRVPQSRRVPARDIAHVYRKDRPGQVRGVPWLAPVILRMHDFDDYEDAQLMRQKIAACFAAFVTDPEGTGISAPPAADGSTPDAEDPMQMEPGLITTLKPGKTVEFSQPPGVDGYADYTRVQLRAVAMGLGVPYELLTGDLTGVNYSSGRMGWLEFQRSVAVWQRRQVIGQFCGRVTQWFAEAAMVTGTDAAGLKETWTTPQREMIDPTKEVPAARDSMRSGQTSFSEMARQRGKDPREHAEEIAADFAMLDELGISLDSDPRRPAQGGGAAPAPDPTEDSTD